jgi:hypothetical protein
VKVYLRAEQTKNNWMEEEQKILGESGFRGLEFPPKKVGCRCKG